MRCSAWSSLAISVCRGEARLACVVGLAVVSVVTAAVASPAGAHIDATPAFLEADATGLISLTAHNDRRVAMDEFAIVVPAELRIDDIGALEGWEGSVDATTATWTAGSLPAGEAATFSVFVEAPPDPGTVSLRAEQRYPDGEVVSWPVALTVVPGDESSTPAYVWVLVGGAGVLAVAGVALAWVSRGRVR